MTAFPAPGDSKVPAAATTAWPCSTACSVMKLPRPTDGVLILRPAVTCCCRYRCAPDARLPRPVKQSYPTLPTQWPPPPCCNSTPACAGAGSQRSARRFFWLHGRNCWPGQHPLRLPAHPHCHPGTTQGDAGTHAPVLASAASKVMHSQLLSQQLLVRQHGAEVANSCKYLVAC